MNKHGRFEYRITVEYSDEDSVFVARVPALPGCAAHGDTAEEATHEAIVAATGILAVMREQGDAVPESDLTGEYSGNIRLRLPRFLHAQLARRASAESVSLNQLMVTLLAQQSAATHGNAKGRGIKPAELARTLARPSTARARRVKVSGVIEKVRRKQRARRTA